MNMTTISSAAAMAPTHPMPTPSRRSPPPLATILRKESHKRTVNASGQQVSGDVIDARELQQGMVHEADEGRRDEEVARVDLQHEDHPQQAHCREEEPPRVPAPRPAQDADQAAPRLRPFRQQLKPRQDTVQPR